METSPFTSSMKWAIGGLTVAFIALGVWLGFALTQRAQQVNDQSKQAELPKPVASVLTEPTPRPDSSSSNSTDATPQAQAKTATQKPSREAVVESTTTSQSVADETTLSASIATAGTTDQILITVAANEPVVIGFSPLGSSFGDSDYAEAKTLSVPSFSGTRTLIVRSKSGQELRFEVTGSTMRTDVQQS
jgi:hypothetical protein